jgi:5-methylcytosine-specific restriction endonuclease McrA
VNTWWTHAAPVFVCADGTVYSEVHHIVPLGEGGEDVLSNVACVCPAHHREAHLGKNARDVEEALKAVRLKERPCQRPVLQGVSAQSP